MMKVVCISAKAQNGKDFTASCIEEYLTQKGKKVLVAHYGDLLKYVCKQFFGWDGKKDEAGRTLLQKVGTEKVRAINPNYWTDFLVGFLKMFQDEWDVVVVADTRFPNEVECWKEAGFDSIAVRVTRPNFKSPLTEEQQQHASEIALDNYEFDEYLTNDGTDSYRTEVQRFCDALLDE